MGNVSDNLSNYAPNIRHPFISEPINYMLHVLSIASKAHQDRFGAIICLYKLPDLLRQQPVMQSAHELHGPFTLCK